MLKSKVGVGLFVVLIFLAASGAAQDKPKAAQPVKAEVSKASAAVAAPSAPVKADAELEQLVKDATIAQELLESKEKAAGIAAVREQLNVKNAAIDAWVKKNKVEGWAFDPAKREFTPPPAAAAPAAKPEAKP